MKLNDKNLLVHSVFPTLSGEIGIIPQGSPAVFIRLAVCDLRCPWCDATGALTVKNGMEISPEDLLKVVSQFGIKNFVITGGEPLLQMTPLGEFVRLLHLHYKFTCKVQVETSGHIIPSIDDKNMSLIDGYVVDYKLPSSGMEKRMLPFVKFLEFPNKTYIKFVVNHLIDFIRMAEVIDFILKENNGKKQLFHSIFFAASPVHGEMSPLHLWKMIFDNKFLRDKVILNIQIHKIIGQDSIETKPYLQDFLAFQPIS
jgi:organic radical activating enzyme